MLYVNGGILRKIILLILVLSTPLYSQESETEENKNHFLSLSTSGFSGYGISYRYQTGLGIGIKATSLGFFTQEFDENNNSTDIIWYNFGGELQFDLNQSNKSRLYLLVGAKYLVVAKESITDDMPSSTENEDCNLFSIGLGVGLEYNMMGDFYINCEVGYIYFDETTVTTNNLLENKNKNETGIIYALGIGVSYNF